MWFVILGAVQIEHDEPVFYTYKLVTMRQLYQQHRFILSWIGNQHRLSWLHMHCVLSAKWGGPWIAE